MATVSSGSAPRSSPLVARALRPRRHPQRRVTCAGRGPFPWRRPAAPAAPPHRRAYQVVPTTPPDNPRPRRVRAGHVPALAAARTATGRQRRGCRRPRADPGRRPGAGPGATSLLGRRRKAPRPAAARCCARPCSFLALLSHHRAAAAATVYTGYNVFLGQIPDAATVASMEPAVDTNVYAADGTLIDILHPSGSVPPPRRPRPRSPPYLQEATVDVEDRHFYTESSLDLAPDRGGGLGLPAPRQRGRRVDHPGAARQDQLPAGQRQPRLQDQGDHPRQPSWSTTSPRIRSWRCT